MLESRWARVVLPAEEGPEIPNKNTVRSFDAVGWLVADSVETAIISAVEIGILIIIILMIDDMKHFGKSRGCG